MMRRPHVTILALALLAQAGAAFAQPMQPGQWTLDMRITTDAGTETLPPVGGCITQRDIDDATRVLPRPGGRCVLTNVERSAERATYDVACMDGALVSKGKATVRFAGPRYAGEATMKYSDRGAPERTMTVTINGQRTGDCAK